VKSLGYQPSSEVLDEQVLAMLAESATVDEPVRVPFALPEPRQVAAIPAGAVIGGNEDACVLVPTDSGAELGTAPVAVVATDPGVILVEPGSAPELLVANPWALPGPVPDCG
jgi:hypothetical protein